MKNSDMDTCSLKDKSIQVLTGVAQHAFLQGNCCDCNALSKLSTSGTEALGI